MHSVFSLPPSGEVEMGDDIPRSLSPLTTLSSRSAMSDVAHQSSAVADNSGEVDRQRQLAQYEIQQQEIKHNQQIELVRQNATSMLQKQTQAHREEATYAIGSVNNLIETTLNKLNKQNQEQQQMAANDERTKPRINAQRNKIRNQENVSSSPGRAKPKTKSEPNPIFNTIGDIESGIKDKPPGNDDTEATHPPKGQRGRPANTQPKYQLPPVRKTIEKPKQDYPKHDTEKDENRARTHWKKHQKDI